MLWRPLGLGPFWINCQRIIHQKYNGALSLFMGVLATLVESEVLSLKHKSNFLILPACHCFKAQASFFYLNLKYAL